MPNSLKLSVVIACFNEEGNVRRYPSEVFELLSSSGLECEFVLVDDGSTDGTLAALEALRAGNKGVVIATHASNLGLGAGLRTGFSKCSGDLILTLDADLTFHPRQFPAMLDAMDAETDCVLGSPLLGRLEGVSVVRGFLSWGVNRIYQVLLGQRFTSASSIFRLYRAARLRALTLSSRSFDINAEILFKLIGVGAKIKEVPVSLTSRVWGQSKINVAREISNHLRVFWKILRWRFRS